MMRSNLRWCSDGLEFTCWNGDVIRLAFLIDAHDREIISWRAVANAGISGTHVLGIASRKEFCRDLPERRRRLVTKLPHGYAKQEFEKSAGARLGAPTMRARAGNTKTRELTPCVRLILPKSWPA